MSSRAHGRYIDALASRVRDGADASWVVAEQTALWSAIAAVLIPIVGVRGVAALYQQSITLATTEHAFLAVLLNPKPTSGIDVLVLGATLATNDGNSAARAAGHLLHHFTALLDSLIGPSLTERLLGPVWVLRGDGSTASESPS